MNRDLYYFGNFFLGITVIGGLLQTIIRFQLGGGMLMLESFPGWFLVLTLISLMGGLLLLKYFYHQQYRFALVADSLAALASLVFSVVVYLLLSGRGIQSWYLPAYSVSLVAGTVASISLIVPPAGKSPWIRSAGLILLLINLVSGAALIGVMRNPEMQTSDGLEKLAQWISLVGSLVPLLFIVQFTQEARRLKPDQSVTSSSRTTDQVLTSLSAVVVVLVLVFGVMLAQEAYMSSYWNKRNAAITQQMVQRFEEEAYVNKDGDTLRYLLLKPLDYAPNQKYPLVVTLPYNKYEGAEVAKLLSEQANRSQYPAFLFVPYCPPGEGWGGIPNYPTIDTIVFETLQNLKRQLSIDEARLYVTGISRGGYGSWHFIGLRPDIFAAAIPVCGGGDPSLAHNMTDVSVWAFHGRNDRNVPVSGSRDIIEAIKEAGGEPRYTEFPDEGHNIWYQVSQTPGLLDWLFAQKQN
uniref:Prolyl oligopeptidase family serine peptidase n=1 Tax=Roseihalotalea indica TaxID=2867963 RepID=A0AA49GK59_9BACT|nr:prolyl oligopeptidase family serine peptidase [Tunicatimonas sp. TK19036]